MKDGWLNQETVSRLMRYSAAAGLGAFAFGPSVSEALSEIVYVDMGGLVILRGEGTEVDVDGDGYNDFRLLNTSAGGLGGYGLVQMNTSIDSGWYGLPGSGTNPEKPNAGATYLQIDMTAPSTHGINAYYCRSFIDGHMIGPDNPDCWDETGTSAGRLYGVLSQYPGWDQNSFWNPSPNPGSYGFTYNEYAGLRMVDTNGDQRWAWVRFQVTVHDAANVNNLPFPDGQVTRHDFFWDLNRTVTLFDYAYENTLDTGIPAGAMPDPTLLGDLNGDGFVGLGDLDIVLGHWNQTVTAGDKLAGDPSGDGYVGLADLDEVLGNWNAGTPPASVIPEPGALGLFAAGAGALAFGRRRRA